MPTTSTYATTVTIPTIGEFAERFPQYGPRARSEGRAYFDLVMRPEAFVDASSLTRCMRIPAVTAIADAAVQLGDSDISGTDKQFLGALMCCLMEYNGFEKTGRKGSVPHPAWNRGEVYRRREP